MQCINQCRCNPLPRATIKCKIKCHSQRTQYTVHFSTIWFLFVAEQVRSLSIGEQITLIECKYYLSVGAAYLVFLLVGVPIAMIYIGFTSMEDCPAEPMIPIYLLASGSFSVFRTIWYFLEFWIFRRHLGMVLYDYVDTAMAITTACMASLYLFGLYWVLHIAWPNLTDPKSFNYCLPSAYILAFVTIIGILILIVFWCMCVCVLAFQVVPVVNEEFAYMGLPVSVPPQNMNALVQVQTV